MRQMSPAQPLANVFTDLSHSVLLSFSNKAGQLRQLLSFTLFSNLSNLCWRIYRTLHQQVRHKSLYISALFHVTGDVGEQRSIIGMSGMFSVSASTNKGRRVQSPRTAMISTVLTTMT